MTRVLLPALLLAGIVGQAQTTPDAWTDDLSPITAADWTSARAAHLIERAGFGETPDQIVRLAAMTPTAGCRPTGRLRKNRQQSPQAI